MRISRKGFPRNRRSVQSCLNETEGRKQGGMTTDSLVGTSTSTSAPGQDPFPSGRLFFCACRASASFMSFVDQSQVELVVSSEENVQHMVLVGIFNNTQAAGMQLQLTATTNCH